MKAGLCYSKKYHVFSNGTIRRERSMQDAALTGTNIKVLIVEDELIIAKGLAKRLVALGYAVAGSVASGEEALLNISAEPPDIILMDIHLQGNMDGVETAEKIRSISDIPLIYLTAYADPDSLARAKITEPHGYIVKPFQDLTLRSAIEMGMYKHRMESRLRRSEQWLATILRSIGDGVIATDAAGKITFMNPVAEALTGWRGEESIGRELTEVFTIRDGKSGITAEQMVKRVILNGKPVSMLEQTFLLSRDGREIPIEAKATLFSGVQGVNAGLALVFLDITEQIRTEEALRRSERLLAIKNQIANIFLTIPDEEMYMEVLDLIKGVMESEYGLYGFIDEARNLVAPSLTRCVWEECRVPGKAVIFPFETWGGLWGRALTEKKSFFANRPFTVPQGHIPINSFLTVPVLFRGETIGLVSVANKAGGYTDDDRELLESIVARIAPILQARLERDRQQKERRRVEEELLKSESQLRSIFDAIPDLISIIDKDYRIILSNWHGGYDYVPEKIRATHPHCYEAYYGTDRVCEPCHVEEAFRTGTLVYREKYNAHVGFVEIYGAPIFDGAGNVVLVVEIVRDITQRKIAVEALATEKERLAVTLCSIGDGVITTDIDGRIVLINRMAEEMTGWSQEVAIGKPFAEVFNIINEKTRLRCESPVDKVLAKGTIVGIDNHTVLISRHGKERIIADSGAPIRDQESRIVGAVLVFRDITDKLKMEEELFKAQKLESIGILAGGIAHDFNNLLTAILGNISLAKLLTSKEDKIHQKLIEAEKASVRAKDLTQQLLTFSRGGAPVKKATSIAGIIRDSAGFALSGSKVTCQFNIPDDLWPAEVDEGQISQVINNLIINANQAMPDGGIITVACKNIYVGNKESLPLPGGRYVLIDLTDQGTGINQNDIPRIFDPYFTTKKSGKGLGLATVYSIVKNHDGHINVDTATGRGTTFTIYLPAADSETVDLIVNETLTTAIKGKILVMDDEEVIRVIAGEILEFLGYEVEFAGDGNQAIELYKKAMESGHPFIAVIMDLTIPGGMGGKETIQILREIDQNITAIASSGYSNDPIMAEYKTYGFSGVITKPYMVSELERALNEVLARSINVASL
jgi:PAS domain S-box-containing protein